MSDLTSLIHAENRARELFAACVERNLIVPGKTERELSEAVCELAETMFGVERFWHKRIVRAGRNTMLPYAENPPDLVIGADDILFFDFGPVFGDWEADLGATYVVGDDPRKHKLAADIDAAWNTAAAHARAHPALTAAGLYAFVGELARAAGWELGHVHCGHIVGKFPHERDLGDGGSLYLRAENPLPLRRADKNGEPLRWILEIHFIDRAGGFGGFQEALLLLD